MQQIDLPVAPALRDRIFATPDPVAPAEAEARLLGAATPRAGGVVRITPVAGAQTRGIGAIAPLVSRALRDVWQEPDGSAYLDTMAAELTWLFPGLRDKAPFAGAPLLTDIAIAPSRRRLHKESEQILRVTICLGRLLRRWLDGAGREVGVIHAAGIETLDEHSLRILRRLARVVPRDGPLVLFSSAGAPPSGGDSFKRWTDNAPRRETLIEVLARETGWRALGPDRPGAADTRLWAVALAPADPPLDTQEMQLTRHVETCAGNASAEPEMFGDALVAAVEESVFTLNFPHARALIGSYAGRKDELPQRHVHELVLHLGFCEAFIDAFESAAAAFELSLEIAETDAQRAQSHFFLALLKIKRLRSPLQGRAHLDEAIALFAGRDDDTALNELAWLYNLRALSFVETRDAEAARKQVMTAIRYNKRCSKSADSIHLKINLLSNLTNLEEFTKKVPRAIERWSVFEPMLDHAAGSFAKHFHYRMGGLLAKIENFEAAAQHLERAYAEGVSQRDQFYCALIARDLGGVYYRAGHYETAANWYADCIRIEHEMAEPAGQTSDWLAHWFCRWRHETGGDTAAEAGVPLYKTIATASYGAAGADTGEAGQSGFSEIERRTLPRPGTKLNRPFHIANLYG
jgi:tetratricopeptide (TPR) repeat protein